MHYNCILYQISKRAVTSPVFIHVNNGRPDHQALDFMMKQTSFRFNHIPWWKHNKKLNEKWLASWQMSVILFSSYKSKRKKKLTHILSCYDVLVVCLLPHPSSAIQSWLQVIIAKRHNGWWALNNIQYCAFSNFDDKKSTIKATASVFGENLPKLLFDGKSLSFCSWLLLKMPYMNTLNVLVIYKSK